MDLTLDVKEEQIVSLNSSGALGYPLSPSGGISWGSISWGRTPTPSISGIDGSIGNYPISHFIDKDRLRQHLLVLIDDMPEDNLEQQSKKVLAQDLRAQLKPLLFASKR